MNREEAKKHLHELVDQYMADEDFDFEEKEDWESEFMEWMESRFSPDNPSNQ